MLAWTASGRDVVNAVVRVSGKVVVCEEGLRAEEVEVVALVFDDEGGDVQKQLEKIWSEVPVFTRWEEALDRFPVIALSEGSSRSTSLLAGAWASAAGFLAVMMLMGWSAIVPGFSSAWVGLGFFTSAFLLSWGASLATQPLLKSRGSALALGFVWYLGSFSVLMVTAKTVELAIGLIYAIAVSMFSFFWVHVLWLARVVWFFSSRGRPWSGFMFDNLLFIFSFGLVRRAFMFVTKQPLGVGQQGEEWFPPRVRGAE